MDINEKVTFNDLNVYILEDIFRCLPLKERMRFERVSKEWKESLDLIWTKQKDIVLSVNRRCYYVSESEFNGNRKGRQFGANDVSTAPFLFFDKQDEGGMDEDKMSQTNPLQATLKLISHCSNLKALVIEDAVDTMPFGLSPLAHLRGVSLNLVGEHQSTPSDLKHASIAQERSHVLRFLCGFPSLESLNVDYFGVDLRPEIELILPQLKELSLSVSRLADPIEAITDLGRNLTKLVIKSHLLEDTDVESICQRLTSLESLSIVSCLKNITFLRQLKHLKEIYWKDFDEYPTESYTNEVGYIGEDDANAETEESVTKAFNEFIHENGAKLTSLSLETFLSSLKNLEPGILLTNHPNIIRFKISFDPDKPALLDDVLSDDFRSARLRELTLDLVTVTRRGVINLLNGCPKLRHFEVTNSTKHRMITSETILDLEDLFKEFASKHPKRKLTFKLILYQNKYFPEIKTLKYGRLTVLYENPDWVD